MPRYVSGRAKRISQTGITSDRYEFLGLEQAEPNLGDPKVGPSSVGANPIKAGLAYQLLAIDNYPGERYWSTLAGIGSTIGTISVYNENVLITENFAAIHGLDFIGTGVTVIRPTIEGPFPGVGIATIQIEINDLPNQGQVNQIIYNSDSGYAIGASDFYYVSGKIGIGTTNPSQALTVFGNGSFTGNVTATNFIGNVSGNSDTATNVIGGIGSLTSLTVSGITTLGFVTAQNAYVSGIITAGYFDGIVLQEVSRAETSTNVIGGIASVSQLQVNGISTLGFITASNAFFTGVVTASQFIGTASFATTASRLQTARTINVVGPEFNSTGKLFDGTADIAIDLSLKPIVGLNSGVYGSATFIPVLGINSVGIITSATTVEITSVQNANYALVAGYSTVAGFSTVSGISTLAQGLTGTPNIQVGIVTATEYYGIFKGTLDPTVAISSANYANVSGISTNVIGGIASVSQLNVTGISTLGFITANNAFFTGIVTASEYYGLFKGTIDSTVTLSNAEYAKLAGIASNVIGGIASVSQLQVNGISTLGFITASNAFFTGVVTASQFIGTASFATTAGYANNSGYATVAGYSTSSGFSTVSGISTLAQGLTGTPNIQVGIVTATEYYGIFKGTIDTGVALASAEYAKIAGYSTNSGIASYAVISGYSTNSGIATYATVAGYSTNSGIASYAVIAGYSTNSGIATYAVIAGYSTVAGFSTVSGISTLAQGLTGTPNIQVGIVTASEYYGVFKGTIDTGVSLATAEYAKIAGYSTNSGIATYAAVAGYSTNSGIASYAVISGYSTNSGIATYATIAGYSTNSGIATYALTSGISTNVIGGIASVSQLKVNGISTLGFITANNAFFTGIVTASEYYGIFKGTIDTGVSLATAEYAKISGYSTNSGIATYATIAGYSTNSGIASYAVISGYSTNSGIASYAVISGYSTNSGIATYAARSGISTNVIGGIASVSQLNVTGISTLGFITANNAFFTGIVTATEYYGVFKGTIDTGVSLATAEYAKISGYSTNSGIATYATIAGYSTNSGIATYATIAGYSTNSGIATYAVSSGISTNVIGGIASVSQLKVNGISTLGFITATSAFFTGIVTATEYYGVFKGTIDTGVTLANAEYAKIAGYSTNSGIASYSVISGYSTNSGIATYATVAGYSTNSGIATYAARSGIATSVIGGIASVSQLKVNGISTLGFITATSAFFTGIVTATEYYGVFKGTIDTGVTLTLAEYAKIAGYSTVSGISTNVIGGIASVSRLQVNGISTLGSVEINSGIITAKTGVVTYYGDGSKLTGVIAEGISFNNDQWGVNSSGIFTTGFVGIGTTVIGEALQVGGNLRVGLSTVENYIAFHGTYGDGSLVPGSNQTGATPSNYNHTYIGERIYGGIENSELLIFKGNDPILNSYDRIRLFAPEHYFDTYSDFVSGSFASVGSTTDVSTRLVIKNSGKIGINTTTPLAQLHVMNSDMTKDSLILIETDTYNLDSSDANYQTRGILGFTENRSVSSEPHVMYAAVYYGDGPEITNPVIGQNSNTNKLILASARRSNNDSTIGGIWFAIQDPATLASQTTGQTGTIELFNKAGFSTVTIQAGLSAWGNFGIGTTVPTSKLEVIGDARIGINTSQGVILTSPNGTKYRLIVDNAGNLSTVAV